MDQAQQMELMVYILWNQKMCRSRFVLELENEMEGSTSGNHKILSLEIAGLSLMLLA